MSRKEWTMDFGANGVPSQWDITTPNVAKWFGNQTKGKVKANSVMLRTTTKRGVFCVTASDDSLNLHFESDYE